MAVRKELELNSFDDFAQMLQDEENNKHNTLKNQQLKTQNTSPNISKPIKTSTRYYRKSGPMVISIEEYKNRVKNGELPAQQSSQPKSKVEGPKKQQEKASNSVKKDKKKLKIKKPEIKKNTAEKKEQKEEKKKQRRIAKISKQIEKNLAHQTRYTEPKKRNLLSRIILQTNLARGDYDYIKDEYNTFSQREIDESKNAAKRSDRWLYKEVQAYEDAKEDVKVRKGWTAFKIGLATAMLAGSLALANHVGNEVKRTFEGSNSSHQIVSIYDVDGEQRDYINSKAYEVKEQIIETDGYHFDNLSEDEFVDGYYRMLNYEKRMNKNIFESAGFKITENRDQTLLDEIVQKSFDEDYENLTEAQRRDYKQLAFELLPYALPKIFENGNNYLRNPIVFDELTAKNTAKSKGYGITLRVNGDEKETVRNLGNIIHILNGMEELDYKLAGQMENGQQEFFDDILIDVIGDKYNELSKSQKRDYEQIIYEWLPDEAKQYIKDPIELEKTINDIEIGD